MHRRVSNTGGHCAACEELTSRDKVPSAANFPPHVKKDPILLLGPRGLGNARVEFLPETLSGLIVRPTRKILGNLVPTVAVLADSPQEEFVLLKRPPPLPERGIERVDPALATGLVRSALNEFGNLNPVDLFASGCNVESDEGSQMGGARGDKRTVGADGTDEDFVFTAGPLAFWK